MHTVSVFLLIVCLFVCLFFGCCCFFFCFFVFFVFFFFLFCFFSFFSCFFCLAIHNYFIMILINWFNRILPIKCFSQYNITFWWQNPEWSFVTFRLMACASSDLGGPTNQSDSLLTHALSTAATNIFSPFEEIILETAKFQYTGL